MSDNRREKYGRVICRMLGYDPDAESSQGVPRWRFFEEMAEEVIKIADEEILTERKTLIDEYWNGTEWAMNHEK